MPSLASIQHKVYRRKVERLFLVEKERRRAESGQRYGNLVARIEGIHIHTYVTFISKFAPHARTKYNNILLEIWV